tara:strand:+ start:93 stop:1547 length:1455 start_codon:yes stop_codon:yes gene_type:complete
MANYIGKKGYSVYKKNMDKEQIEYIKKELYVKPFVPKAMSALQKVESFPIYRESNSKFYLPKYFGLQKYGIVENKIVNGKNINVNFNGKLRDYQEKIVDKYMNYINTKYSNFGGGCLEIDTGLGKTVIAINIISRIKLKTIILVHKEFLMNQWVERINEFMPNIKIGKIQGKTVDIENNDVVIGMIQSLSMKDYDSDLFNEFGLMIIDEVHHMGAEVFSQALSKVVTAYTLGLSATMERKDGLSKVFKMFIGETIHVEKRDTSKHQVLVKCLKYKVDDDEFNEIKYDFRGNVQYSSMITKLCSYNHRSEYIIKFIIHTLKENPKQQIIILAHNKSLLKYLHDAILNRNIADVGYYVGGMKEAELKISETKKVIIATYSMASEGLDIKTLTTLLLATPKTDIVQAVGRILRTKHEQPVVIDVVDDHEIFKKQFSQRKRFYVKQKYKIIEIDNTCKNFNNELWTLNYDPSAKNVKKTIKDKCLIEL